MLTKVSKLEKISRSKEELLNEIANLHKQVAEME
jgi:hypothetical protein